MTSLASVASAIQSKRATTNDANNRDTGAINVIHAASTVTVGQNAQREWPGLVEAIRSEIRDSSATVHVSPVMVGVEITLTTRQSPLKVAIVSAGTPTSRIAADIVIAIPSGDSDPAQLASAAAASAISGQDYRICGSVSEAGAVIAAFIRSDQLVGAHGGKVLNVFRTRVGKHPVPVAMLAAIPGVSADVAEAVLKDHRTIDKLCGVLADDPTALQNIIRKDGKRRLGPAVSKKIAQALDNAD